MDRIDAIVRYEKALENENPGEIKHALVIKVTQKQAKKLYVIKEYPVVDFECSFHYFSKPLPLTTVDLQKAGSRLLKISPKRVLDVRSASYRFIARICTHVFLQVAEKLYQQGFLSYPRTETNQYDPQFDFMTLIDKQKTDGAWGQFATGFVSSSLVESCEKGQFD